MKIRDGYSVRKIGSQYYAVLPARVAEAGEMIALNDTGVFVWELLQKDIEMNAIVDAMVETYAIDREIAQKDAEAYIHMLKEVNALA